MMFARRLTMLRWVLSLLGAVSGAGCKPEGAGAGAPVAKAEVKAEAAEAREYTFEFPLTKQIYADLIGDAPPVSVAHAYTFAAPLRIAHRDEPVDATAYVALTMPDGKAVTGKYALKAILRSGYTGGPPGSATERFVETDDVHLVEKLQPPKAPKGVKALLPGQGVVRKIPVGAIVKLEDRYVVELPADMPAQVWLLPSRDEYDLDVTVTMDSVPLPTLRKPEDGILLWNTYRFRTTSAGVYEVRVRPDRNSSLDPDSYMICIGFGNSLAFGSKAAIGSHRVKFRDHAPAPSNGKR